jgi:hypothetical protein
MREEPRDRVTQAPTQDRSDDAIALFAAFLADHGSGGGRA